MIRRTLFVLLSAAALVAVVGVADVQAEQQAFGRQWGRTYNTQDWNRFYHYPYVYYPQNFWAADYFRSNDDLTTAIRLKCRSRSTTSGGRTTIPSLGSITQATTSN